MGDLTRSRNKLNDMLTGSSAVSFATDASWETAEQALSDWWKDVKDEEAKDTFSEVLGEKRMTVRAMADNRGDKVLEFQVKAEGAEPNVQTDRKMTFAYGVKGVQARGTPENFVNKQKNKLGLHELSASLLTGDRGLAQNQIKYYASATYVFMPLPREEDLQVFAVLNGIAKTSGSKKFKDYVRMIASKLTRVKSAYEYDMGTTYCDIADRGTQGPGKFRYGLSGTVSSPGKKVASKADDLEIARRKQLAIKYKSILSSGARNEIVVAYRQHGDGTTCFPLFTRREGALFPIVSATGVRTGESITLDGQIVKK